MLEDVKRILVAKLQMSWTSARCSFIGSVATNHEIPS
jgi:hypothetical protein